MLRQIGSLWFAAVLLVLALLAMACATVVEAARGSEQALALFYRAWWFRTLLGLLALNALAAIVVRYPFGRRQIGFLLTHASILVILAGALTTKLFGVQGRMAIAEGASADSFDVDAELLTVERRRGQGAATIDLTGLVGRRFEPAELRDAPPLSLGALRVVPVRYLPDSEWTRRVTNDNPQLAPAVELSLSAEGRQQPAWVFAGRTAQVGGIRVSYRRVAEARELARLLNPSAAARPGSPGTVRIEHAGQQFAFPLEQAQARPVPLGTTGYVARVLRYLPHATVGRNNQIVNASSRPVNPYVEVQITGPQGSLKRRAFARFPDFDASHGSGEPQAFRVTLLAAADDSPDTPIEVLSGPHRELFVRFSPRPGLVTSRQVAVGDRIDSPWPGRPLTVLRQYDHARVRQTLVAVAPLRETRTPALRLRLTAGGSQTRELWVQKYRPRSATIGGSTYELAYADRTLPLSFTVRLERFRVGFYPGGRRPRSFESHLRLIDQRSGRSQRRVVSMNNPVKFGGYAFYQSSYRQSGGQTISFLSVARDPGRPVVFAGYVGLLAGMLWVLATRVGQRSHRSAEHSPDGN